MLHNKYVIGSFNNLLSFSLFLFLYYQIFIFLQIIPTFFHLDSLHLYRLLIFNWSQNDRTLGIFLPLDTKARFIYTFEHTYVNKVMKYRLG